MLVFLNAGYAGSEVVMWTESGPRFSQGVAGGGISCYFLLLWSRVILLSYCSGLIGWPPGTFKRVPTAVVESGYNLAPHWPG